MLNNNEIHNIINIRNRLKMEKNNDVDGKKIFANKNTNNYGVIEYIDSLKIKVRGAFDTKEEADEYATKLKILNNTSCNIIKKNTIEYFRLFG